MVGERVTEGPGLIEVAVVWGMLGLDAAAIYRLYAGPSTAPGMPIRVSGPVAGVNQLLVFGRHPALPVAIAIAPIVLARLPARDLGAALSAAVAASGLAGAVVARAAHGKVRGDARDSVAAAVVVGALTLTVETVRRGGIGRARPWDARDRGRLAAAGIVLGHGLPWILADLGAYAGDLRPLGRVFLSRELLPEGASIPAVHIGHHHGLDGTLLALASLTLARALPDVRPAPIREALSAYLAYLLVYGLMRATEDGWNEQIVKRGRASARIPVIVARRRPVRPRLWAGMLGAAAVIHRVWFRRTRGAASGS